MSDNAVSNHDRYRAFMVGFMDAVAMREVSKEYRNGGYLEDFYAQGWSYGRIQNGAASELATLMSNYNPAVVRLQRGEDELYDPWSQEKE